MKHENEGPVRRSVHVDCPVEEAFRLFTQRFGEWWPLASYSEAGPNAESCEMEPWVGGRVFERTRSGEEWDWGSVIRWDPPTRVEFAWSPGRRGQDRETVNVEFCPEADGTRVTVTHRGWHLSGVAVSAAHTTAGLSLVELLLASFVAFAVEQMVAAV
jgi:hypothetical protein